MTLNASMHRWTLATLLVAVSAVTFAPMAHADWGGRRWKHAERGPARSYGHGSYYRGGWGGPGARVVLRDRYQGGAGPLFAGLVGGMILGSVLQSHAQPVLVREDTYCPPRVVEHVHYYYRAQPQVIERDRSEDEDDQAPQVTEPQRYDEPQAAPAPVYRYEDGNGERWWDTLDECTDAARQAHGGPKVIKVVDDSTNQLVKTLYWNKDHWIEDDGGR